jgi:hypothetical protein
MLFDLNSHESPWEGDFTFLIDGDETVTLRTVSLRIDYDDAELRLVRARFLLEGEWVAAIQESEIFHMAAHYRRPPEAMLEADVLELELLLDPALLEELPNAEDAQEVIEALMNAHAGSPLRLEESWYALNVRQDVELPPDMEDVGTLKAGYSLRWNEEIEAFLMPPQALYNTLRHMFDEDGWDYHLDAERYLIHASYEGEMGSWEVVALVRPDDNFVLLYSRYPQAVPQERRLVMAELIARANFDLPIGNFELNMDTGELRYKTSLEIEPSVFDVATAYNLLLANLSMMDLHWPAIEAVVDGQDAQAALALIED